MLELKAGFHRIAIYDIQYVHREIRFEQFVIGSSSVSMFIQRSTTLIFEHDESFQQVELKANGTDVYHGQFLVNDNNGVSCVEESIVNMNIIEYKAILGI